jgi:hypothetical protein
MFALYRSHMWQSCFEAVSPDGAFEQIVLPLVETVQARLHPPSIVVLVACREFDANVCSQRDLQPLLVALDEASKKRQALPVFAHDFSLSLTYNS